MSADRDEVDVQPAAIERLQAVLTPERAAQLAETAERARVALLGRRVVNVNSTASGGGVAELLQTLLAYAKGAQVDARWLVIDADARFFEITKRVHNHLYGTAGDGGPLGAEERAHYEGTLERNVPRLQAVTRAGDILLLHDPQTAGLAPHFAHAGARIVWRCHVGIDVQNEHSEKAWEFLRPYLERLDGYVFSRAEFAPPLIPRERLAVIPPSIDPFSAKNTAIPVAHVAPLLEHVGLLAGAAPEFETTFTRRDGSIGRVERPVDLLGTGPPPATGVPLVLQASRWDLMKDMPGVMLGFATWIAPRSDACLVLAGPECAGVADDPEAVGVLQDCVATWQQLPAAIRRRVHLVCVPMTDPDEAATIVNALQRHATVVVQKSLAEGFGLTVTEGMWKERPVVASAVGGIVDQVLDGETGFLVEPEDLEHFGHAVCALLESPPTAHRFGVAAREHVRDQFLGDRHLEQWAELFARIA